MQTFTGRSRRRKTSKLVQCSDLAARILITLGGIGTIIAVSTVCIFLIYVTIPLFIGSRIEPRANVAADQPRAQDRPLHLAVDEYRLMGWMFFEGGELDLVRLDSGALLRREPLFEPGQLSSAAFFAENGRVVFGLRDGRIRLGRIAFQSAFLGEEDVPAELRSAQVGHVIARDDTVVQRVSQSQFRSQSLSIELEDPIGVAAGQPIVLIDQTIRPDGPVIAMLTVDGKLRLKRVSSRRNLLTGQVTTTLTGGEVDVEGYDPAKPPRHLLLSGIGDSVYLAWRDGRLLRFDSRQIASPALVETLDLVPEDGQSLTALTFMIGKTSLVSGDSLGRARTWFRIKPADAATADGAILVESHTLSGPDAAVTALAPSARDRKVAAGYADGSVRLFHVTSNQLLDAGLSGRGEPIEALALSPKDDGLLAADSGSLTRWDVHAPHPETTLAAIFTPVWYEGYERPAHVWQSSSGTDDFEPKYGLYPLIFGSIKATIYCMLFGVPLALLAAVYTSEFLHPRTKARVKPTIELMASLPSVVLGFLAALVFAPFIEDIIPQFLAAFATVPFAFLLGAFLWQLLPEGTGLRLMRWRFPIMFAFLPLGLWLAWVVGPIVEQTFFWVEREGQRLGDIRGWLAGQEGAGGAGGWLFILLPLSAVTAAILIGRYVNPLLRRYAAEWSRPQVAAADFIKFLAAAALTILIAVGASYLLAGLGWDPRGSFVGTYVQRNALIVGFVMGFAVIPIIYTIAEDALAAVPEHLRAASLGAGATAWQTAMRIVIPTAMSGLFSAIMIGFGRAVGETMIVLMAAGNTPIMDWNIFNGFRTLSANIAVELPEAVVNSTHYRMLFLAALTLFAMTFLLNTIAETVRLRFRRRAYQL